MKVQVIPTAEQCLTCKHCPADDAPPCEQCVRCQNNPENVGELLQFVVGTDNLAYGIVIIDDEFYTVNINEMRVAKPQLDERQELV